MYLFDEMAGAVSGQGWDEPTLPPWHGIWWLVNPSGQYQAWPETLTTTHIGGKTVLAALMLTGIGWERFPVYSYSKDTSSSSQCTGTCAVTWPPVISSGSPALVGALSRSSLGAVTLSGGTSQLSLQREAALPERQRGHRPRERHPPGRREWERGDGGWRYVQPRAGLKQHYSVGIKQTCGRRLTGRKFAVNVVVKRYGHGCDIAY